MKLAPSLLVALDKKGIQSPLPIQALAIPIASEKSDAIVVGQTGGGKTLAYVLPILTELLAEPKSRALVLAPSREVCDQVFKVFNEMIGENKISTALIIAGTPNKEQVSKLKKIPRIIVATPGRLNEHLTNNKLLLQGVTMVVIDESDRMLDMGFAPQLDSIRKTMRGNWQTLMYSASFSKTVETVAQKFMQKEPFLVRPETAEKPVQELRQKVLFLDKGMKNDLLSQELRESKGQVIVFAASQPRCEIAAKHLKDNGFNSDYVHGDLKTGHRDRVLREFREGKIQIIVTTDLLARGLDVPNIECVVNYDLPFQPEDFLHRIGRTARAGSKGRALTLITPQDLELYQKIKKYLDGAEEIKLN